MRKKIYLILSLIIGLSFIFAGCEKDNTPPDDGVNPFLGKWKCEHAVAWEQYSFLTDKTFTLTGLDEGGSDVYVFRGSYSFNDDYLHLTWKDTGEKESMAYRITASVLTLNGTDYYAVD